SRSIYTLSLHDALPIWESCIIGWKNHSPIFRASAEACSAAPRGGLTYHAKLRGLFGRGVDHLAHFGDLGRREAADLGVLFDDRRSEEHTSELQSLAYLV